jgi:hypothetical protein
MLDEPPLIVRTQGSADFMGQVPIHSNCSMTTQRTYAEISSISIDSPARNWWSRASFFGQTGRQFIAFTAFL